MSKIEIKDGAIRHWCPGCKVVHLIPIGNPYTIHWVYTYELNLLDVSPSVRHDRNFADQTGVVQNIVCHYFIHNSNIEFCADSMHSCAGMIMPLQDMPEESGDD